MSDKNELFRLYKLRYKINEEFNVNIQSKSRKRNIIYPRKIFCKIAYENFPNLTLDQKGKVIGLSHVELIYHHKTFDVIYDRHKEYYNKLVKLSYRSDNKKRKDALKLALFYRDRLNKILGTEWQ